MTVDNFLQSLPSNYLKDLIQILNIKIINIFHLKGKTALQKAVEKDNLMIVKFLIGYGSKPPSSAKVDQTSSPNVAKFIKKVEEFEADVQKISACELNALVLSNDTDGFKEFLRSDEVLAYFQYTVWSVNDGAARDPTETSRDRFL